MKFHAQMNKIDPEMVEFYQQWQNKRLWVCAIHIDFIDPEWLEALETDEDVEFKLELMI